MTTLDSVDTAHYEIQGSGTARGSLGTAPSVLDLAAILLRHLRSLVGLPIAVAIGVIGVTLAFPRTYTSTLSFTPTGSSLPSGSLASLAGQLGFNVGLESNLTPDFYGALLSTREILEPLVVREYTIPQAGEPERANFIQLYAIDENDSSKTIAKALETMREEVLGVGVNRRTGIVTVSVTTESPALSHQIANGLLERIEDYNFRSRQRQRGAERAFLEERLDTARTELRAAQNRLQEFYANNRSYENDPALRFEADRLQRDVTLRSEVFGLLTQSYEQARVAAVRNTPSVALVEEPRLALRPDRRNLAVKAIGGLIAGLVIALTWILVSELVLRARAADPEKYRDVSQSMRTMLTGIGLRSAGKRPRTGT